MPAACWSASASARQVRPVAPNQLAASSVSVLRSATPPPAPSSNGTATTRARRGPGTSRTASAISAPAPSASSCSARWAAWLSRARRSSGVT